MDGSEIAYYRTKAETALASKQARQKHVVVAGGAGFLGSHLCDVLLSQGHRVTCVDNLMTGRFKSIEGFLAHPRFSFVQQDVIAPIRVTGTVDEIYNMACPASPPQYQKDPIHTFQTCVVGSLNLLELARRKGARILQSSTSEVYGDPEISPQPETYRGAVNTVGPRACYDEGKRAAETLFYEYGARKGVETRIARIFNTYGPRMSPDDGRVVSNFVVQALSGQDITIYGDGRQTRSFCYVDDLVDGLMRLMAAPKGCTGPINLGNPGEFTMRQLAMLVLAKTSSKSRLVYCDLPTDDPRQRRPDISVAGARLEWAPLIPLEIGLDHTIAYFSRELGMQEKAEVRVS